MANSILIIGHPASGKTTFLAQFFIRLEEKMSSLQLARMPENINAIKSAIERLSNGEAPMTTSASDNVELVLSVLADKEEIDLICPDYGGEQVSNITDLMEIDQHWIDLLASNHWLLFVRPHQILPDYDLSITSYEEIQMGKSTEQINPSLSKQSKLIELIQSMLYARGIGIKQTINNPSLTIVLSCWDELNTINKPLQVLKEKLPLLVNFIGTIWDQKSFKVLGLSAQEFPLDSKENKEKYQNELPESFGYIITHEGKKDNDITKLIQSTLKL